MGWLDWLEVRFGRFAIPRLVPAIIGLTALVYILSLANPAFPPMLTLDMAKVMDGQVWRLVTFLFVPMTSNLLFLFFSLYVMWIFGEGLEQGIGSFKLNVYYLLGTLGTIFAAFITGAATPWYLHASLLFGFATLYPNRKFQIYFILPVEVRWIAWFTLAIMMFSGARSPFWVQASTAAAFANYLIFFGPGIIRRTKERAENAERKHRFKSKLLPEDEPLHRCAECGATEFDQPDREFRVRADGEEYCDDCLERFRHKTADSAGGSSGNSLK